MAQYPNFKTVRRGDSFYDAISMLDSPESSTCASMDRSFSSSGLIFRHKSTSRPSAVLLSGGEDRLVKRGGSTTSGGGVGGVAAGSRTGINPFVRTCTPPMMGLASDSRGSYVNGSALVARVGTAAATTTMTTLSGVFDAADACSVLFASRASAERYLARHHLRLTAPTDLSETRLDDTDAPGLARVQSRTAMRHLPATSTSSRSSTPADTSCASSPMAAAVAAEECPWSPLGPLPTFGTFSCESPDTHAADAAALPSATCTTSPSPGAKGVPAPRVTVAPAAGTAASANGTRSGGRTFITPPPPSPPPALQVLDHSQLLASGAPLPSPPSAFPNTARTSAVALPPATLDASDTMDTRALSTSMKRPRSVHWPGSPHTDSPPHHSPTSAPAAAVDRRNVFRSVLAELMLPGCPAHVLAVGSPLTALVRPPPSIFQPRAGSTAGPATGVSGPTPAVECGSSSQMLSHSRLHPSTQLWSPLWIRPSSPSSASSVGTPAVVFMGEYSLRQLGAGTSFVSRNDVDTVLPSAGSFSSAEPQTHDEQLLHRSGRQSVTHTHNSSSQSSRQRQKTLTVSSPSYSDDGRFEKRYTLAAGTTAARRSQRHHQLFRVRSDGTLIDESSDPATGDTTTIIDDDDTTNEDNDMDMDVDSEGTFVRVQETVPGVTVKVTAADRLPTTMPAVVQRATILIDSDRVAEPRTATAHARQASRRASRFDSLKTQLGDDDGTVMEGEAVNPISPLSGLMAPNVSAMTTRANGDMVSVPHRPSEGFQTFSAELLVFGGAAAGPAPRPMRPSWVEGDEVRGRHPASRDTRATPLRDLDGASSPLGESTVHRGLHAQRAALERTLHSTLGLIPAGLADDSELVAAAAATGPGADGLSSDVLHSTTLKTDSHMPSNHSGSRRRSMLSLTATAAQSQTWFGASALISTDQPSSIGRQDMQSLRSALLSVSPTRPIDASSKATATTRTAATASALSSTAAAVPPFRVTVMETSPGESGPLPICTSPRGDSSLADSPSRTQASAMAKVASWPRLLSPGASSPLMSWHSDVAEWPHALGASTASLALRSARTSPVSGSQHGDPMDLQLVSTPRQRLRESRTDAPTPTTPTDAISATDAVVRQLLSSVADSLAATSRPLASGVRGSRAAALIAPAQHDVSLASATAMSALAALSTSSSHSQGTHSTVKTYTMMDTSAATGTPTASMGRRGPHTLSTASSAPGESTRASRGARHGTTTTMTEGGEGMTSLGLSLVASLTGPGVHGDGGGGGSVASSHVSDGAPWYPHTHTPRSQHSGHGQVPSLNTEGCSAAPETMTGDRRISGGAATESVQFIMLVDDNAEPIGHYDDPLVCVDDVCAADRIPQAVLVHTQRGGPACPSITKAPDSWRPRERHESLNAAAAVGGGGGTSPRSSWARGFTSSASSWASVERPRSVVILDEDSPCVVQTPQHHGEAGAEHGDFPLFGASPASRSSQGSSGSLLVSIAHEAACNEGA